MAEIEETDMFVSLMSASQLFSILFQVLHFRKDTDKLLPIQRKAVSIVKIFRMVT
jgi:hypothetical protein